MKRTLEPDEIGAPSQVQATVVQGRKRIDSGGPSNACAADSAMSSATAAAAISAAGSVCHHTGGMNTSPSQGRDEGDGQLATAVATAVATFVTPSVFIIALAS